MSNSLITTFSVFVMINERNYALIFFKVIFLRLLTYSKTLKKKASRREKKDYIFIERFLGFYNIKTIKPELASRKKWN